MGFSEEQLNDVYDKTGGYCEYCGKKIAFVNYGLMGGRGAWEVDHSNPRSRGGTDYMRNLVPACIPCNRDKSDRTGKSYRASLERSAQSEELDWGEVILGGIVVIGAACAIASILSNRSQQT
ncbi:MAG: HNH endonuclease signature motif containing protein [Thermoplasmata archaeon]